jgi:heme oxygenase
MLAKFPAGENISRLKKDLENANVNTKEIPVMRDGLKISSPEAVVAYLYIREGSKLGGQVISKNLQQVLSLQPETHNSYFWGEGKNTGARWREFITLLTAVEKKLDISATARYAVILFESLENWLSRPVRDFDIA